MIVFDLQCLDGGELFENLVDTKIVSLGLPTGVRGVAIPTAQIAATGAHKRTCRACQYSLTL